jgi:hypothetical protein
MYFAEKAAHMPIKLVTVPGFAVGCFGEDVWHYFGVAGVENRYLWLFGWGVSPIYL